jgi:hypothetical protein
MKNRNQQIRAMQLAIPLLACLVVVTAGAQQSGTFPKGPERTSSTLPGEGAAGNPSALASSPKVVLKIGDTQITESEIESVVPMRPSSSRHTLSGDARRRIADQFVRMILLSQQAADDQLDATPELRFKLEMLRIKMLAQAELDKMQSQIQITSDDIDKYYYDHLSEFDTVQVREFIVRKRLTAAPMGSSGLSAEEAKATAESIRERLVSNDSPDKIAENFSGPDVLLIDSKPRTLRRAQLTPDLAKAVFESKDGTGPGVVDTPDAVLIIDVLKREHVEEKEAAAEIEKKLRQLKLDAQINDMKRKVQVWMDDSYFKVVPGGAPVSDPMSQSMGKTSVTPD